MQASSIPIEAGSFPFDILDSQLASVLQAASQPLFALQSYINANSCAYYTLYGSKIAASKLLYKELNQKRINNHSESTTCFLSVLDAVEAHG